MEEIVMSLFGVFLIIVLTVLVDYFLLDVNKKRWGWMKNWTNLSKGLFFTGFIIASVLIYIRLSNKYF